MTAEIFHKWFRLFEERTRTLKEDGEIEPRLMIYDGHLSHVDLATLRYARNFKVTIIKLPPHTTELLQPLDVAVFSALKVDWGGGVLFQRLRNVRSKLSKAEFAQILASGQVWDAVFSIKTIESGFRKCGIFPVGRTQYPEYRFSPPVLEKYNKWVEDRKPEYTTEEFEGICNEVSENEEAKGDVTQDVEVEDVIEHGGQRGTVVSFFIPSDNPTKLIRLTPQDIQNSPLSVTSNFANFKELCLKRLDETPKTLRNTTSVRRGVNPYATIVTSDVDFAKAEEEVEKKLK